MNFPLIDTHAHLDMAAFDRDRAEVVSRAGDAGVSTIISVGIDLKSSQKAIALAESYPEVLATVGVHPHDVSQITKANIASLADAAGNSRVVAIGEIGLDFYRDRSPREIQTQAMRWQLELAEQVNLPVVIHCRQAEEEMLPLLRDWTSSARGGDAEPRGVIHCFNGDIETAQQYLEMGFYLSLGAYISYPSSRHLHNIIRWLPLDRLMLETDCPFLPPQEHRGKRNEPSYLLSAAEIIGRIKGASLEVIARETTQNARRLFRMVTHSD